MPLPILTLMTKAQCTHSAPATYMAGATKVLIDNAPAMLSGDQVTIMGCPFTVPPGKPQPCVTGKLSMPAATVMIEGKPAMLQGAADMGYSPEQAPGGPLIYTNVQTKVLAT